MLTYHQVPSDEFDADASEYLPVDYETEGFIHTTRTPSRVSEIANKHRRDDPRPFLLLTIDLDKLSTSWRYDLAGEDFPHIYGPLNREAIVTIEPFPRAADGSFLPISSSS
jgi:uncharacterized protein (DUF952 family)